MSPRAWRAPLAPFLGGLLVVAVASASAPRPLYAQATSGEVSAAALEARAEDGNSALLPLVNETIVTQLDDGHASEHFEHVFQNESKARVEGNYRLMIGEGAAATGFAYMNGKERIVGEIFEREAAQSVYEAMTGLRKDPGLLEQAGEGAFSFRVFPIEPGEKKKIEVDAARWLPRRDGAHEYRLRISREDADVRVALRDGRGIGVVESPTHDIVVEGDGSGVKVRASRAKTAGTKEFVLRYRTKDAPYTLRASTHRDASGSAFLSATLATPPSQEKRGANDVTLVLDRSGSMSGAPIEAARSAARKLVTHLGDKDAVNVIVFDDKVEPLFDKPRLLTSDVRREVDGFLEHLSSRGGTDIASALSKALAMQTKDERPDVVIFMTDGQSDGPKAIDVAQKDKTDTRVFVAGLGEGVDKALLNRIATLKHGRFTFIPDFRSVEVEFGKIMSHLVAPTLSDVKISVEGSSLERVYPATLPDLFADDELRVFGRLGGGRNGKVVVVGKQNGIERRFEVPVDPEAVVTRPWVARSWARSRVDDLLESEKSGGERAEGVRDEVIDLGLSYNLVTPYTSFLAIPEKEMTEAAREATASMRERKKKLLLASKDSATLSRLNMPPGDPILSVVAPRDAKKVTALFPFGLVQDLTFDAFTERWTTRFLVPKDVPDGTYEVPVLVTLADGRVEATSASYTIDAKEPAMTVDVRTEGAEIRVRVQVDEPALEVRVAFENHVESAVSLAADPTKRTFEGVIRQPKDGSKLRVVVADIARNEAERLVDVVVKR